MIKKRFNLEDAKSKINSGSNQNEVFMVICDYMLNYQVSKEMSDKLVELAKEKNKTFKPK